MAPQLTKANNKPIMVELFAGSCVLSKVAQAAGWEVVPIDWAGSEHKPQMHRIEMDLTSSKAESVLFGMLARPNVRHIHIGLPCGTGSRAREIPIRAVDRERGVPEVRPLRTDEEPMGRSDLWPREAARVAKSNALARLTAKVIDWAHARGLSW